MKESLSIIIIAADVEKTIRRCLLSCRFAKEIILITSATDQTISIAKKSVPNIKIFPSITDTQGRFNYALARNLGLKYASMPWLLYVDDDEIISPKLKSQIINTINSQTSFTSFDIPRANFFMGHRVRFGGSYPDYVKRLFRTDSLQYFEGALHEQPKVDGISSKLTANLHHYTHESLNLMLQKSQIWTKLEADLIYQSGHPPVVWWRFIRMMLTKLWERLISQSMWRDGIVGWISVIFEMYDTYMIYAHLYELQKSNS
jgi:glycosyltransferase involved in cell wall biosynthesis